MLQCRQVMKRLGYDREVSQRSDVAAGHVAMIVGIRAVLFGVLHSLTMTMIYVHHFRILASAYCSKFFRMIAGDRAIGSQCRARRQHQDQYCSQELPEFHIATLLESPLVFNSYGLRLCKGNQSEEDVGLTASLRPSLRPACRIPPRQEWRRRASAARCHSPGRWYSPCAAGAGRARRFPRPRPPPGAGIRGRG
jgi:hypothetical protein